MWQESCGCDSSWFQAAEMEERLGLWGSLRAGPGTAGLPLQTGLPLPPVQQRCARLWAESRQLGGILPRGLLLPALTPLLPSPSLVPAVRGPWAVAGGEGLRVHVQGGAWASNKLCRAPLPCPLHGCICLFPPQGEGLHQLREALKILAERVLILETMIGLYGE